MGRTNFSKSDSGEEGMNVESKERKRGTKLRNCSEKTIYNTALEHGMVSSQSKVEA